MGFMDAMTTVYRNKYATFSGRASRSEYWWSYLAYFVIATVLQIVSFVAAIVLLEVNESLAMLAGIIPVLVLFAMIIPFFAVTVRRFHDTGKSGWMILILFVPCIGTILWLVWMIEDGQAHDNAYGPVPTNLME